MNVHLFIHQFLKDWLLGFDIPEKWANLIKTLILVFTLALVCYIINLITKKVIRRVVGHLVKRSKAKWDNVYFEKGVFTKFSHYIPALIIYYANTHILIDYPLLVKPIISAVYLYMVIVGLIVANSYFAP